MLSSSVILTEPRTSADRFIQCPVIFLRSSTAANCRTSGDGELRTWCSNAGTSCGSLDNLRICSSACFRASLSGTRNCLSRSSSWSMATAPLPCPVRTPSLLRRRGLSSRCNNTPEHKIADTKPTGFRGGEERGGRRLPVVTSTSESPAPTWTATLTSRLHKIGDTKPPRGFRGK